MTTDRGQNMKAQFSHLWFSTLTTDNDSDDDNNNNNDDDDNSN